MVACGAMRKLRECDPVDLLAYYNRITSRPRRGVISVGLAYATFCALLLQAQEGKRVEIDPARLQWGTKIQEYADRSIVGANSFNAPTQKPTVRVTTMPLLYGADGRRI